MRAIGVAFAIALLTLYGCEREGPAERTGKKLDSAVEKTGEKIEQTGDKVQDAAKDARK